jgi:hypothetical protein
MPSLSRELISGVTILCSAEGRGEHAIRLLGLLLACWACCWPCGLLLACWACCWPCGLLLSYWACWPAGLAGPLSLFSFAVLFLSNTSAATFFFFLFILCSNIYLYLKT